MRPSPNQARSGFQVRAKEVRAKARTKSVRVLTEYAKCEPEFEEKFKPKGVRSKRCLKQKVFEAKGIRSERSWKRKELDPSPGKQVYCEPDGWDEGGSEDGAECGLPSGPSSILSTAILSLCLCSGVKTWAAVIM